MANIGDDNNNHLQGTPIASNPSPNPKPDNNNNITPGVRGDLSSSSPSPEDFIRSVASKLASQPLQDSEPDVWGVLTAISEKARRRRQGLNMLLTSDEHLIGRLVTDKRFEILSNHISSRHCKIYRQKVAAEDAEGQSRLSNCGFLKDNSTNGTYLNWQKLNRNSPECKLQHGDIISFAAPPQHELAYAYVFREVLRPTSASDSSPLKRKADELGSETKRQRGIGIGASEGPISLDDFRSLQRSNTELRKQLEDQVATINQLRSEHRAATELHEVEKKNLKESISNSYQDELKEIRNLFEEKQKELVEVNKLSSEQKSAMVDLNERLNASMQSCTEANEIMRSQNASISELKILLDEERDQRKKDREKADANLTASIQRVKAEAQEELKRLSDASFRRENEQQEIINKLQESEKERCSLVETLRSKLQEQLKSMQRTPKDEENYENISVDINPYINNHNQINSLHQNKQASQCSGGSKAADSTTSTKKPDGNQPETSSDEQSMTEKHECDARIQETCEETQEAEFGHIDTGAKGGFGSDIEGLNTAPIGTETQGLDQNLDLNKIADDTMVIDDETERVKIDSSHNRVEEDTEAGDTIRTADLLASEVAGSWACGTAPSCHGENESLGSGGDDGGGGGGGGLHDSVVAESQTGVGRNHEHEAITKMIGIVAPEMKGEFGGVVESDSEKAVVSNSDTDDCTEDEGGESEPLDNNHKTVKEMDGDDDDEATQQDSG